MSRKPTEPVRVQVALRVRPLVQREIQKGTKLCIRFVDGEPQVVCGRDENSGRSFTYDMVFPPETPQEDIYNSCVEPLIEQCFHGFNATILAYGQTGSGKTYTMGSSVGQRIPDDQKGIIPRVIEQIFERVETLNTKDGKQYSLRVSFMELYNEDIKDMFSPEVPASTFAIREEKTKGIYVTGITESEVSTKEQLENVLRVGSMYRTVGVTDMNEQSSRSHAIFTIIIHEGTTNVTSKFHFVDLAGSERLAKTKAEGATMKEGISINSGLLALGNVINALGDPKRRAKHVPYRDSKLTRILQDSLGGNSQTLMIACASPALFNYEETLNTLKYADRARQIKNKPVVNLDPVALELANLRKQVQLLKAELVKYKEGGFVAAEQNGTKQAPKAQESERTNQLEEQIKKLKEENDRLTKENSRIEARATDLKERVVKLESEREVDQLRAIAAKGGNIDSKFEEMIHNHIEEIEDLKDKLGKTEAELNTFKTFDPSQFNLPDAVESALSYELDQDFNLQISASTQKILEELQKSDLFDFDTDPDYVPGGSVVEKEKNDEDWDNLDSPTYQLTSETSDFLNQVLYSSSKKY